MAPLIEAHSLYRFFHTDDVETLALQGVSLAVEPSEVVAVTGPSGSGKSTLMACLAGLDEPDGGTVRVLGARLSRRSEAERATIRRGRIGVLLQSGNLLDHLTTSQNVALAQRLAGRIDRQRIESLLESVGLSARAHAYPSQLSGGEAARAGLAVALANAPALLLADEPTGEVDSANEGRLLALLRGLAAQGMAVIVVTHSPAVAAAADRVISLMEGRVVAA
jgi:putative ABC transport system ATP-binding protein